ncbi:hypothetical protein ACFY0A_46125 [Streptomyces sp. NPDC001698]|uniref:hypothetical protein n=1 Tax=Streptomyces sp. NPDC001698 TaxID=3364601 RepID=UPI0036C5C361
MAGTNALVWVLLGGCVVALGVCVVGGLAVVVRGKVEIARIHAGAAGKPRKS